MYRVMKVADDKPEVGTGSCMLGARISDIERAEGDPEDGPVGPLMGGLSVYGCLRCISFQFLPKRLLRGAKGSNNQKVWTMGQGNYENSPVTADLNLRIEAEPGSTGHGILEANREMPLDTYQNALAATQDQWHIDEFHPDDCPICKQFGLPKVNHSAH